MNTNWFKTGIYSKQLSAIAVLLLILTITIVGSAFDKSNLSKQDQQTLVKAFSSEDNTQLIHQCVDPTHKTCDGTCECDGLGCAENIMYENSISQAAKDYQIVLQDDQIVIMDKDRVVGVLSYRTSLGRMMIRDNE